MKFIFAKKWYVSGLMPLATLFEAWDLLVSWARLLMWLVYPLGDVLFPLISSVQKKSPN